VDTNAALALKGMRRGSLSTMAYSKRGEKVWEKEEGESGE